MTLLMPCCCPCTPPREPKFTSAAKTCVRREHVTAVLRGSVWSTPTAPGSTGMGRGLCQKHISGPGNKSIPCRMPPWLPQLLSDGIPWRGIAVTHIALDALELDSATEQPF